jgi:hypothetical protein
MSGIKHKHAPEMGLVQPTSPRTQCSAQTEGARNKQKAHTNQSCADVVKSWPRNNTNAALWPLNKR